MEIVDQMALPKLTPLELTVMDALWREEMLSIREIQETSPAPDRRPVYTTVQTIVYRLEEISC